MSDPNPCARAGPNRGSVLALLLVVAVPPVAAAAPLGFSEAIRLAVERAPQLDAQRSRAAAAREELARADALPDPKLIAGIQNLPIEGADAFALGADGMTMRRIGLSQAFPSRAKRDARRLLATATLEETRAQALATALEVRRAAAEAWIALWAAEREHDMLRALAGQAELAVRSTGARLSGGVASAGDALAARSVQLDLANQLDAVDSRVAQARAGLSRWLGSEPDALAVDAPEFARVPHDEAALLAALDRHGELLQWAPREAQARAGLALARAGKRPDWALSGGYAQRGADLSDVVWLEASIDLPLFARSRQDRGVAARRAELDALRSARIDARREQAMRVRSLFAAWSGLGRQVARNESEILPLAADRSQVALAAYSGGDPLRGWIEASRDELAARVAHSRLLAEWGRAWAALAYLLPAEDAQ